MLTEIRNTLCAPQFNLVIIINCSEKGEETFNNNGIKSVSKQKY